jgi:retinol dehydrogenase-12
LGLYIAAGFEADYLLVVPWGRFAAIREDMLAASKMEGEGGSGIAHKFWEWNEEQIKPY